MKTTKTTSTKTFDLPKLKPLRVVTAEHVAQIKPLRAITAEYIDYVVDLCDNDRATAARILGVNATTLWRRLGPKARPATIASTAPEAPAVW